MDPSGSTVPRGPLLNDPEEPRAPKAGVQASGSTSMTTRSHGPPQKSRKMRGVCDKQASTSAACFLTRSSRFSVRSGIPSALSHDSFRVAR